MLCVDHFLSDVYIQAQHALRGDQEKCAHEEVENDPQSFFVSME